MVWNRGIIRSDFHIRNHTASMLKYNFSLLLAISIIQMRDDDGLDYDSSGRGGNK